MEKKDWLLETWFIGSQCRRIRNRKVKCSEQPTENKAEKDGWCLSNTIQLSPSQSKQFLSFLEQNEEKLKDIIAKENEERSRILGEVYSLILSWHRERKAKETLITPDKKQDTKPATHSGVSIP